MTLHDRILKSLRPGPKSTGELEQELDTRADKIRGCCKELLGKRKVKKTRKRNPWATKRLLFCVDCRLVMTADTYESCPSAAAGHDLRGFWPTIPAWMLA